MILFLSSNYVGTDIDMNYFQLSDNYIFMDNCNYSRKHLRKLWIAFRFDISRDNHVNSSIFIS